MRLGVSSGESRTPRYLVGFAALLTVVVLLESAVRVIGWVDWLNGDPLVFTGEYLIGLVTALPFVLALGYTGYWLPRSELERARYPRIWRWVLGLSVASLLFNLALIAVIGVTSGGMFVAWVRWSVAVGSGLGLVVGVSEAKAVQNSIERERVEVRAEHVARQRDFLDYLNSMLRHEILNTTQVIAGNAELLTAELDPESEEHAYSETIYRQSEDVTSVIENARTLLNAAHEEPSLEPVNVAAVLADEVESLERRYGEIEVAVSIPEEAYARANPLVERVFGNLLTNAVEHNDSDVPRIRASMTTSADAVTVEIADNGPGISDEDVPDLFERLESSAIDHGLGLYLVGRLTEQVGGTVELVETGDQGSVFRVELQRARVDSGERPADSAPAP